MLKKGKGKLFGRWFIISDINGIVAGNMAMLFDKYQKLLSENKLPDVVLLHSFTYEMIMLSVAHADAGVNITQPKPLYPVNGY
jgi:hypothetical protein